MTELPREPDDRTALYWPEDSETYARLIIRDDRTADAMRYQHTDMEPNARWFEPNYNVGPHTWEQIINGVLDEGTTVDHAVVLRLAAVWP